MEFKRDGRKRRRMADDSDGSTYSLSVVHGTSKIPHMGVAGWIIAVGVTFLLLPVLPFLVVYYLLASGPSAPN